MWACLWLAVIVSPISLFHSAFSQSFIFEIESDRCLTLIVYEDKNFKRIFFFSFCWYYFICILFFFDLRILENDQPKERAQLLLHRLACSRFLQLILLILLFNAKDATSKNDNFISCSLGKWSENARLVLEMNEAKNSIILDHRVARGLGFI